MGTVARPIQFDEEIAPVLEAPWPKRLLVIGCPRSGTQFITGLLNNFGMRVAHERMAEDGTVNCAWLATKMRGDTLIKTKGRQHYDFDQIVHIVRHPLKCIDSMSRELPPSWWDWQEQHSKLHVDPRNIEEVAAFWVFWADGCQHLCDQHIRLEDIQHLMPPRNVAKDKSKVMQLGFDDLGVMKDEVLKRCEIFKYK